MKELEQWYKVELFFTDGTSLVVKVNAPSQVDLLTKLSKRNVVTFTQDNNQQYVVDLEKVKYSEVNPW